MCDTIGCDELEEFIDLHGNVLCQDCVDREVAEENQFYEDYISL